MHISLDSALGRQRRLNSVGESVLQIAPDAAAAYSLRSLTGGDPNVVRVRRESDNTERDFAASQIESGEMARWVNEQPTLPLDLRELDTNTGERDGALIQAAAAYSLRKLKEDFTGDVVEVRRNVDGETEGFTAAEVTDGTLESFVNASFDDELPLDQATGAAAAYSLRNLSSSFTGDVVEVRRSSDGTTQSFTASEVANGTLESFCGTEDITSSLNLLSVGGEVSSVTDRSNFTITYFGNGSAEFTTLRSNSTLGAGTYKLTGTIVATNLSHNVQFRSAGGGSTYQSSPFTNGTNVINETFTLTGDPNNLTIYAIANATGSLVVSNLKLEQISCDGHVRTWYDQSGSDNHAVQTTPANQPKIVDGGTYLGKVKFDGTDDVLDFTTISLSTDDWLLSAAIDWDGTDSTIIGGGVTQWLLRVANSNNFSARNTNDSTIHNFDPTTSISTGNGLFTILRSSDALEGYYNGEFDAVAPAIDSTDTFQADRIGLRGSAYSSPSIKEIIIYNSDQSTKRRAIEENIANHYDISLAAFSRDGTVSTWYDQSGSTPANHATQTDPTKQPDIVVNGTYLEEVDFNGTSHYLDLSSPLGTTTEAAVFTVAESGGGTDNFIIDNRDSGGDGFRVFKGGTQLKIDWQSTTISNGSPTADEKFVGFAGHDSANLSVGVDGGTTAQANTSTINVATAPRIGARSFSSPSGYWDGTINELIIYNSDQSDNRTAIEANIGETYGITDIPAADDTVNGYVQTWYDQSGEGNDAVQTTAANQPKIVGEKTSGQPHEFLGAIDFDGSGVRLTPSSLLLSTIQNTYTATVSTKRNDSEGYIAQINRSSGNRYYYSGHQITIGDPAINISTSTVNGEKVLLSVTASILGLFTVKQNGSTVGSTTYTGNTGGNDSTIGAQNNGLRGFDGLIDEILVYDALPSNNEDIETNIANHYGITLS
jgi:hypothetical protein